MSSEPTPRHDEQFCATCGAVIKKQAALCPDCGSDNDGRADGPSTFRYCESCGEQIASDTELCPGCGVRQPSGNESRFDASNIILWLVGVGIMLWGASVLTEIGTDPVGSIVFGLGLLVAGCLTLPPIHQRLGDNTRRHSLTAFGNVKSVEKFPVHRYDGRCSVCDGPVKDGMRREYADEFVLFGSVLSTSDSGSNVYCERCAIVEDQDASEYPETNPPQTPPHDHRTRRDAGPERQTQTSEQSDNRQRADPERRTGDRRSNSNSTRNTEK